ncbi:MAG: O-antigen ligase family protein [Opitutaceae bacterium]|nr:O-antigen ligase family protein [Opitutaceae bacterium]
MTENTSPLPRWDRPIGVVLLGLPALIIIAATLAPDGATRIYTWPWAFYVQAAMLAPWGWCAWSTARGDAGLRVGWTIALPLVAALGVSIVASAHRHVAFEAALVLATPLLLIPFLARAWRCASPRQQLTGARLAGAALALVATTSLIRWLAHAPDSNVFAWFLTQRNPHPLGHWNYTGGLALLLLPIAVLLTWRERGIARAAWSVSAMLGLALLVSAGSRGAVLGLATGAALTALAAILRSRLSGRALALGFASMLLLLAVAFMANPRLRQLIIDPAGALTLGASEQQRLGFILTGIAIAKAHPVAGIGPGATPYHYPGHRVDLPGSLENSFQLHCGPIQWWVDTGTLGLLALVVAGGKLMLSLWRARRTISPTGVAALGLLGGYGGLWLTDYQLDAPIFPAVLALAVAVLVAESCSEVKVNSAPARKSALVFAVTPLVGAFFLIGSWQARATFASAWHAKDIGDANGFLKGLRTAADAAPWQPYYQNHLARALAGIAAHLPPETAAALRAEARAAWERSLLAAPAQDHPWLNLGWLALMGGHPADAAEYLTRAAAIQPRRTGLGFATAMTRIALGQEDAAAIALAREIRLDPGFITSPAWREPPLDTLRPRVLVLLEKGWLPGAQDPGAAGDASIATLGRWWWKQKQAPARAALSAEKFAALLCIDDRTLDLEPGTLPAGLAALRDSWRTGRPPSRDLVPPDLAAAWDTHVSSAGQVAFSDLLRSFPGTATRRVDRPADGILFRQLDGDRLSDLTELPVSPLVSLMRPLFPVPVLDEYFARPSRGDATPAGP